MRRASRVTLWLVLLRLGLAAPVEAGCENSVTVRAPGFEFMFNDVAPYAGKPLGEDATSDSLYDARNLRNYTNLAGGLAVAAQIYRCVQKEPQIAAELATAPGDKPIRLWEYPGSGLLWRLRPGAEPREQERADGLVELLERCVSESTTTMYSVQVGSFALRANANARQELIAPPSDGARVAGWDSARVVDWWNWSCAGNSRPDAFILGPDEAPGPGYKVLHGLFIEPRDAIEARGEVRERIGLPAVVIPVHVTGRILRAALRGQVWRER